MSIFSKIAKSMQDVLNDYANKAATVTGFIQRVREITGSSFIRTLVFGWMNNPNATLDSLVRTGVFHKLNISSQGLDKRFTEKACDFVRSVLEETVTRVIQAEPVDKKSLDKFTHAYIHDSSIIALPKELASTWQGTGGSTETANKAALKVDFMYDLKAGKIKGLDLLNGLHSDNRTPLLEQATEPGSLHIKDLGYFSLPRMKEQGLRGEYWLSRYKISTHMFWHEGENKGKKINLEKLLIKLKRKSVKQQEISVELGAKERLPARLFLQRLSEEASARQRANVKKQAQKHGRTASKARLALCDWIPLVTNAPKEKMTQNDANTLYGARWQIELMFKLWKSQSKLAVSRSKNKWRILCEIYVKLIIVVMEHWILLTGLWNIPQASLTKGVQAIQEQAARLGACIDSQRALITFLKQMAMLFSTSSSCWQNRRRKNPNTWIRILELDLN